MNLKRWIARRETDWKRLDSLLQQVEKKGIKSLDSGSIRELASLYRSVSADLARAKTHNVGQTLLQDLQRLTARGYSQVYQGSRRQEWRKVGAFYRWGFPKIVRETWAYTAIAMAIFGLSAVISWWYAWTDPNFQSLMIPAHLIDKVRVHGELWMGSIVGIEPLASTNIMLNNITVAFGAIAGGITVGIYTIFLMIFNGLSIGAIAALVGQNNLAYPFWAFVLPHGSLELPAIFLAGGAGLLIARAILFPSKYQKGDALKVYGAKASQLLFGIVPMLIIAGTIEGFFSPNPAIPSELKYIFGMLSFILLVFYCARQSEVRA